MHQGSHAIEPFLESFFFDFLDPLHDSSTLNETHASEFIPVFSGVEEETRKMNILKVINELLSTSKTFKGSAKKELKAVEL